MGCLLPVGVTRAAARPFCAGWTGWTGWRGWTGCTGSDLANVVWKRLSAVVLPLCLAGALVKGVLVTGVLVTGALVTGALVTGALLDGALFAGVLPLDLLPRRTSPMSLLVSRLNISRRRGSCLRGCSVSRMTGGEGGGGGADVEVGGDVDVCVDVEVGGDVAAKVGKNGVAVVEGSVGTMLSEIVGRNTEDVSSSKLASSSPSEL